LRCPFDRRREVSASCDRALTRARAWGSANAQQPQMMERGEMMEAMGDIMLKRARRMRGRAALRTALTTPTLDGPWAVLEDRR
jgi:hypothetical protein